MKQGCHFCVVSNRCCNKILNLMREILNHECLPWWGCQFHLPKIGGWENCIGIGVTRVGHTSTKCGIAMLSPSVPVKIFTD